MALFRDVDNSGNELTDKMFFVDARLKYTT